MDEFRSTAASNARSTGSSQQLSSSRGNKKGFMGRLFSRKKKSDEDKSTDGSDAEGQDEFPMEPKGPPPTFAPNAPRDFHPSAIQSKITEASNENSTVVQSVHPGKGINPAALPPPARQSAFHGPPRFDWIDIVSVLRSISWKRFFYESLAITHHLASLDFALFLS
jgi:hypothetical protein